MESKNNDDVQSREHKYDSKDFPDDFHAYTDAEIVNLCMQGCNFVNLFIDNIVIFDMKDIIGNRSTVSLFDAINNRVNDAINNDHREIRDMYYNLYNFIYRRIDIEMIFTRNNWPKNSNIGKCITEIKYKNITAKNFLRELYRDAVIPQLSKGKLRLLSNEAAFIALDISHAVTTHILDNLNEHVPCLYAYGVYVYIMDFFASALMYDIFFIDLIKNNFAKVILVHENYYVPVIHIQSYYQCFIFLIIDAFNQSNGISTIFGKTIAVPSTLRYELHSLSIKEKAVIKHDHHFCQNCIDIKYSMGEFFGTIKQNASKLFTLVKKNSNLPKINLDSIQEEIVFKHSIIKYELFRGH